MKGPARALLAIGGSLAVLALALVYPWVMRRDAWVDASWQQPWLLLPLLVVPVLWYLGIFGQDRRKPRLWIGTVAPLRRANVSADPAIGSWLVRVSISTSATSGRVNSGGGARPPFSISLTCVPDSTTRSSP